MNRLEQARNDFETIIENSSSDEQVAQACFLQALVVEDLNDIAAAFPLYEKSLELNPSAPQPWRERGRLYSNVGQFEKAEQDLKQAAQLDPADSLTWRFLGDLYRIHGRPQLAAEAYTTGIQLDPQDAVAFNNRSIAYELLDETDKALQGYLTALENEPFNITFRLNASLMYRKLGNFEKADQLLVTGIESHTGGSDVLKARLVDKRAEIARMDDRDQDARQLLEQAVKLDPQLVSAWNRLGICHYDQGEYQQAVQCYSTAIELAQTSEVIYLNRGDAYRKLGNPQAARDDYAAACQLNPANPIAFYLSGLAHVELGQPGSAIPDFQKALKLDATYRQARSELANTLRIKGQYAAAAEQYEILMDPQQDVAPGVLEVWGLAECYRNLDKPEMAIENYTVAKTADPKFAPAWIGLGEVIEAKGNLEEAIEHYDQALKINPQQAWPLYRKGFCLTMLSRAEDSIPVYTALLELEPEHVNGRLFRANAYRDTGNYSAAYEDYEQAVQIAPKYHYIYAGRGRCYANEGRYVEAVADYSRGLEIAPEDAQLRDDRARLQASVRLDDVFDPQQAEQDARRACQETNNQDARLLDTLAIALAAQQKFEQAVTIQEQSLDVAARNKSYSNNQASKAKARLKLYRAERPFVQAGNPELVAIPEQRPRGRRGAMSRSAQQLPGGGGSLRSGALKLLFPYGKQTPTDDSESDIPAPPVGTEPGQQPPKKPVLPQPIDLRGPTAGRVIGHSNRV